MIEVKRKRLYRKARRGGSLQGLAAVLAGAPFLAIGVFCILVAVGKILPLDIENKILEILGISFGGTFIFIGGLYILQGVWGGIRKLRRKSLAKLDRDAPWRADYEWEVSGATEPVIRKIAAKTPAPVCLAVFTAPIAYFVYSAAHMPLFAKIIIGIFILLFLSSLSEVVYLIVRFLKYGASHLEFCSFPFFLGERMEVRFIHPRGMDRFQSMEVTLRCIEEEFEIRGTRRRRMKRAVCYQVYAETQKIAGGDVSDVSSCTLRHIRFVLPEKAPETSLSQKPPVYWELQIKSDTPGVNFDTQFLLPVYTKH